jgi:hypothetical protein
MESKDDILEQLVSELKGIAQARGHSIHDSFFEELQNYAGHNRVRDLPHDSIRYVLARIGTEAVESTEDEAVGAGAVREVIFRRCGNPFSTCFHVAQEFLIEQQLQLQQASEFLERSEEAEFEE